jgi:hypothetical protein
LKFRSRWDPDRPQGGLVKLRVVLIAVVFLVAMATAQVPGAEEPQKPKKSRAQVYALEGLGALGGMTGCALGGAGCYLAGGAVVGAAWLLTVLSGSDDSGLMEGWYGFGRVVGGLCAATVPAVAGFGAAAAGERLGEDGSRGWAIGGAYAGIPLAVGAIALGRWISYDRDGWRTSDLDYPFYVLGGLCIPAGAVVGYNLGPKPTTASHAFEDRILLPGAVLTSTRLPDHSIEYGVKVQLAGLRF